jgi:hypothetical protein
MKLFLYIYRNIGLENKLRLLELRKTAFGSIILERPVERREYGEHEILIRNGGRVFVSRKGITASSIGALIRAAGYKST